MTPQWTDVLHWAEREIERARDRLEAAPAGEVQALQSRVATLRELLRLPNDPARDPATTVGEQVTYT